MMKSLMKIKKSILTATALIAVLFLSSCNDSTKGKWSKSDKLKFHTEMNKTDALSELGQNKDKWIECYLSKCEAQFSSFREADSDIKACERLALQCNDEVMSNGSVLGNWSAIDKKAFRDEMAGIESLSNLGENKNKWIECYLGKCEANYASFYAANMDEVGVEKIAFECNDEIFNF